jgi:hypothetical protein
VSAIHVQTALPIESVNTAVDVEEIPEVEPEQVWARACPLCGERVRRSEYLRRAFEEDPYGEWAANLVTHYRHEHIGYYDRTLHSAAYRAAAGVHVRHPREDGDEENGRDYSYDAFKAAVNNRAKRQLIRGILKASMPVRDKYALIAGFRRLEHNDEDTESVITVALSRRRR